MNISMKYDIAIKENNCWWRKNNIFLPLFNSATKRGRRKKNGLAHNEHCSLRRGGWGGEWLCMDYFCLNFRLKKLWVWKRESIFSCITPGKSICSLLILTVFCNKASPDEGNILDQIYYSIYVRICIIIFLNSL